MVHVFYTGSETGTLENTDRKRGEMWNISAAAMADQK